MAYQNSRKDLVHGRAFTTVSTKHTAISYDRKTTIKRASHVSQQQQNGRGSSARSIRTLTFESQQGDQQTANEDEDVLSVKAVPSNFLSVSKPSRVIERFMTKKKNAHETCLEDMRTELGAVHEECAAEFRQRSNFIKVCVANIRKDAEGELNRIQNADLLKLTDSDLQTAREFINSLIKKERSSVDEFHKKLGEIEHDRQQLVKEVMRKYYEIFHSISYTSPVDIQALLEDEIRDYNKTVLTNFKIYADLRLHLCINTEDWSEKLLNLWEEILNRRSEAISREKFNQLMSQKESLEYADEIFLYDLEGLSTVKALSSTLDSMEEIIKSCQSKIIISDASSVSECSEQLNEVATELNFSIAKLVDSYKAALQISLEKYRNEVEFFKQEDNNYLAGTDVELLDQAVVDIGSCYKNAGAKFEDLWNRTLPEVQNSIAEFCRFLHDFNTIWTNQSSRLVELQEATGSFVDELTAKSQKTVEELKKKVEAYNQQLGQASSEEKMKQLLSQISATRELIAEKYKTTYGEECKAIQKYVETVGHEIPKLMEKFDTFLDSYRSDSVANEGGSDSPDSDHPHFVKQHLNLCQNLVSVILRWKETLFGEIVAFRENFPEKIRIAAESWEDTISRQRASVLQTRLEENSQHCEDKSDTYNIRIREIEKHSKQLEDHEMEVKETAKNTSNRLDEFLRELKQLFEIFERDIVQSSEKFSETRSTAAMKRVQKEIERIRNEFKTEVERREKNYRAELQDTVDTLMKKNDNFLNDLRLFKDGGSFSAEEIKSHRKTLTSCSKTISKAKTAITQKIDKALKELSQAMEKCYKSSIDRSNIAMREIKFYEDAQKILTKCASILERQVYRLREDNTRFINAAIERIDESGNASFASLNVAAFAEQCTQLSNLLDTRINNLIVAFPIARDDPPNDQAKGNRKISVSNKRKKQKSLSKTIDYRSLFRGSAEIPARENCFATAATNTILKTIDEIQTEAKNFFSPNKRGDGEANYHEYMQQILHQMNCYRQQLELLWREEVRDVLAVAEALEGSILNCIRENLNASHERHINEMTELKEKKVKALSKTLEVNFARRSELLDSLEITHGHPGRQNALEELTEKVLQEEESMENFLEKELDDFKKELEDLSNSYEISMLERGNLLREVASNIDKKRDGKQKLQELSAKRNMSDAAQKVEEHFYRLDIAETSNRRCWEIRRESITSVNNNLDIDSALEKLLKEVKSLNFSAVLEAETTAEEFLKSGENFRKNWNSNVETVVQVYAMLL